jgi:hypothetical protein
MTTSFASRYGLKVEVAFGEDTLNPSSWTDVTTYAMAISTSRGHDKPLDDFPAGTCAVTFRNTDGRFDPLNAAGPYYGDLVPLVPMRVSALESDGLTRDYLYTGFVQPLNGWTHVSVADGRSATMTMSCVDFTAILARTDLAAITDIEFENEGVRFALLGLSGLGVSRDIIKVRRQLQQIGGIAVEGLFGSITSGEQLNLLVNGGIIPSPGGGWLITGMNNAVVIVQQFEGGQNCLDFVNLLARSEGGAFFVRKDGVARFDGKWSLIQNAAGFLQFNDSGGGIDFATSDFALDYASVIYNQGSISPRDQDPQVVDNATSVTRYGTSTYAQTGLLMDGSAEAMAQARHIGTVYGDPVASPRSLKIYPQRSSVERDTALAVELRDRVTVKFKPPGNSSQHTTDCFIERINHELTPAGWTTTFGFSSAEAFTPLASDTPWTLDGSADSVLDGTRKLLF